MKNNELEKYIGELSPELQEKARLCKDKDELNKLIAENDVELPDDVLEAVAGGGSCSDGSLTQGQKVGLYCTECKKPLYYWDRESLHNRFYCGNSACVACQDGWLFKAVNNHTGETQRIK